MSFVIVYSCLLYHRLIAHKNVSSLLYPETVKINKKGSSVLNFWTWLCLTTVSLKNVHEPTGWCEERDVRKQVQNQTDQKLLPGSFLSGSLQEKPHWWNHGRQNGSQKSLEFFLWPRLGCQEGREDAPNPSSTPVWGQSLPIPFWHQTDSSKPL